MTNQPQKLGYITIVTRGKNQGKWSPSFELNPRNYVNVQLFLVCRKDEAPVTSGQMFATEAEAQANAKYYNDLHARYTTPEQLAFSLGERKVVPMTFTKDQVVIRPKWQNAL